MIKQANLSFLQHKQSSWIQASKQEVSSIVIHSPNKVSKHSLARHHISRISTGSGQNVTPMVSNRPFQESIMEKENLPLYVHGMGRKRLAKPKEKLTEVEKQELIEEYSIKNL